jgi:hypothetical protein
VKLQLVKYHPLFAYSVGDKFEVNDADTKLLLDGKYAVPASEKAENASSKEKKETATGKAQKG